MENDSDSIIATTGTTSSEALSFSPFLVSQQQQLILDNCNQQNNIPIYSFKQQAQTTQTTETNNSKLLLTTATNSIDSDWANSLFRPASRFSITKRRECKSTSDESFTYDLNSNTHKIQNNILAVNTNCHSRNDDILMTNISTLHTGRFGFNPTSRRLSSLTGIITPAAAASLVSSSNNGVKKNHSLSSHNSNNDSNKSSMLKNQRDKRTVKRLSAGNRFYIESHSKKAQEKKDYVHNKKLFHAISNNDYDTVVDLLDSNLYDVNCYDDKQRTCLHIASSKGNLEIARLLLNYGANPNLRDCVCNLPIHLAIISSHVPVVTLLLEAGTDINTLDLNGKTVLHLAGTRLRWLLNDENNKASPKLKFEAIMIMNMIKEYLRQKKTSTSDLDMLTNKLENVFTLDDINCLTKELLNKFETLNLTKFNQNSEGNNS